MRWLPPSPQPAGLARVMTFSLVSNMVFSIPSASAVISAGTTGAAVCPAAINVAAMAGTLTLEHRYNTQAAGGTP